MTRTTCPARTRARIAATAIVALVSLSLATACDQVSGIGQKSGNKIKQGGDAGGSTGYP